MIPSHRERLWKSLGLGNFGKIGYGFRFIGSEVKHASKSPIIDNDLIRASVLKASGNSRESNKAPSVIRIGETQEASRTILEIKADKLGDILVSFAFRIDDSHSDSLVATNPDVGFLRYETRRFMHVTSLGGAGSERNGTSYDAEVPIYDIERRIQDGGWKVVRETKDGSVQPDAEITQRLINEGKFVPIENIGYANYRRGLIVKASGLREDTPTLEIVHFSDGTQKQQDTTLLGYLKEELRRRPTADRYSIEDQKPDQLFSIARIVDGGKKIEAHRVATEQEEKDRQKEYRKQQKAQKADEINSQIQSRLDSQKRG